MRMQAHQLRTLTGCSESDRKAWLRTGVLVPLKSGSGAGMHADFDSANVVATALAVRMKQREIKVTRYADAFAQLHRALREQSSLKWTRYRVLLKPDKMRLIDVGQAVPLDEDGYSMALEPLCRLLFVPQEEVEMQLNLPLGLEQVG